MRRIQSAIDPLSSTYRSYERQNRLLRARLHECQHKARHQRPERDVERLRKQNKLLVHERIDLLLDKGTPFWSFHPWRPTRPTTVMSPVPGSSPESAS